MRLFKLLRPVFLLLMLSTALFLHAQDAETEEEEEGEEGINIESDWSRAANLYTRGDQIFCISLGLIQPLFFVEQNEGYFNTQMKLGGMGSLAYNYFINSNWFFGAELSGMFSSTVGENIFYIVPIGARIGYQFILGRFEFPVSFMLGFAPQSYNERTYFGLFSKLGGGAFFRFNSDWSFGLNTYFWWVPEWTSKTRDWDRQTSNINIHGFFWEISIGARYHF